jgi:catechol 2,3-dioxygenase-like lactoylglutathione lyase family enzyme
VINHISIGVRSIPTTKAFYDAALAPLGYTALRARDTWLGYGKDRVEFSARAAAHPVPADLESGLHICFVAPTRESVAAFYAAALATGGHDNGAPGLRPDYSATYFAAYVIDPDGYRIEAYCSGE